VPGNAINQALSQASALRALLAGEHVTAVVCVPYMKNKPFRVGQGAWVCGASQLGWVLGQMGGRLTQQAADRAASRIRR